jgi:hypothetical protein
MNEKKLKEEIAEILKDWRPHLDACNIIFMFAPSYNRWSFIYEGSPIQRDDPRVRSIPFTTQRPSFMELKRVHEILSTVIITPADQAKGYLIDETLRQSTDSFVSGLSESADSFGPSLSISSSSVRYVCTNPCSAALLTACQFRLSRSTENKLRQQRRTLCFQQFEITTSKLSQSYWMMTTSNQCLSRRTQTCTLPFL